MHLKFSTLQWQQYFCRSMSLTNIPNSGLNFHSMCHLSNQCHHRPTATGITTTTTTTSTIHTNPNVSITITQTTTSTTTTTINITIKSNLVYRLAGLIYGLPQQWTLLRSKQGTASAAEPCDCCTGTSCITQCNHWYKSISICLGLILQSPYHAKCSHCS